MSTPERPDTAGAVRPASRSGAAELRLGFACAWQPDRRATWSGTPWFLREALSRKVVLVDTGIDLPPLACRALQVLHARRHEGRWVSTWRQSAVTDLLYRRQIQRRVRGASVDAVLEIGDLSEVDRPYFFYQDLSYDVLLHHWDDERGTVLHFPGLSRDRILRRRDRQRRLYEGAAGILAMSAWFARTLVEWSGVAPSKVHVVHPGSGPLAGSRAIERPRAEAPRRKLLFIGKDFDTKGGDQVVAALRLLRRAGEPMTLTVAGPKEWPLPGDVPDGVTFLGRIPFEEVSALYVSHDLFVMPSRFEGFGMVFAEALAHGLPCIARDAFAMPEIVRAGENGDLVRGDDPASLAQAIVRTLANDAVYERCRREAPDVRRYYAWDRAAEDAVQAILPALP
jgi:glycosyltransferase involved in cell wall biosynthesis